MKKFTIILFAFVLTTGFQSAFAQNEEMNPLEWFDKETANKAKDILKKNPLVMFNDHCSDGWGAIVTSTVKKVWVEESMEEGYYNVYIRLEKPNGDRLERAINVGQVKVSTEEDYEYLGKMMGLEGDYCRDNSDF